MDSEEWKAIPGYEGYYEVSNLGGVRSVTRKVPFWRGRQKTMRSQIISPRIDRGGYVIVHLTKDGDRKSKKVHRLVASAFHSDYSDDLQVNHLNMDKLDNRHTNLEMTTNKKNNRHRISGEHWPDGIEDMVASMWGSGSSVSDIASSFGISRSSVRTMLVSTP